MTVVAEHILPEQDVVAADQHLADIIGLNYGDLEELTQTQVIPLGTVSIKGTNEEAAAERYHCGPTDAIKRGGTKFKGYPTQAKATADGIDHGRSMFYKIGAIGETGSQASVSVLAEISLDDVDIEAAIAAIDIDHLGYGGGKTIVNTNPRTKSPAQMRDAMEQVAALMDESGLANPFVDGTAGDEGTNGYIGSYVDGLRKRHHAHPEACITGKPDMGPRAKATGRGAAIVQREHMRLTGDTDHARNAVQGSGFAGAYYAAEAYDPLDPADRDIRLIVPAIGDLDPRTERPVTLFTDHEDGLPITYEMIDAILKDGSTDPDMIAVGGFKLAALARKIERQTGREVAIVGQDVLTFPDADYLVPAATSNVITPANIGKILIPRWLEISNRSIRDDALPLLEQFGITYINGELVNAGGVKMSIQENRRDLSRIRAHETGTPYIPVSDEVYEQRLRHSMVRSTRQATSLAAKYDIALPTAVKAVGLANYALSRNMRIDSSVRYLLAA